MWKEEVGMKREGGRASVYGVSGAINGTVLIPFAPPYYKTQPAV